MEKKVTHEEVLEMEILDSALEKRYKEAVKYDASDQWRLGFEAAQNIVLNRNLERFGYDPKKLETNAHNLIRNLLAKYQPSQSLDNNILK